MEPQREQLFAEGRVDEALQLFVAARDMLKPYLPQSLYTIALICAGHAVNLINLGRYAEGEHKYHEAQHWFEQLQPDPDDVLLRDWLACRRARAKALDKLGQFRESDALYVDALHLVDRAHDPSRPAIVFERAALLVGHAICRRGLGADPDDILKILHEAELLAGPPLDDGDAQIILGPLRYTRASVMNDVGRHAEAITESILSASLVNREEGDDKTSSEARAIAQLAGSYASGDAHRQALPLYERAMKLYDSVSPDSSRAWRDRGFVRLNMSASLLAAGMDREAKRVLHEAMSLYESAGDSFANAQDAARCLHKLAAISANQGRSTEAQAYANFGLDFLSELPDVASVQFDRLCHLTVLTTLPASPLERDRWFEEAKQCVKSLCDYRHPALLHHVAQLTRGGSVEKRGENLWFLFEWCLDWMDLTQAYGPTPLVSPGTVVGGQLVDRLAGSLLLWATDEGQLDRVPQVLAARYGRYAAAQRETTELDVPVSRSTEDSTRLKEQRAEYRRLLGQLHAIESGADTVMASAQRRQDLLVAREAVQSARKQLLQTLGVWRKALPGDSEWSQQNGWLRRIEAALQANSHLRPQRVLVLLFVIELSVHGARTGRPGVVRAAEALVYKAGQQPGYVCLDKAVMDAAQELATMENSAESDSGRSPARGDGRSAHQVDGATMREAVERGWQQIAEYLDRVDEVLVAAHQALALLPWQGVESPCAVRVFHGLQAAVEALEITRPSPPVPPPGKGRRFGVIAHSPGPGTPPETLDANGLSTNPIPRVYADLALAREFAGDHCVVLDGALDTASAQSGVALVQLSCHGNAHRAHTGEPGRMLTSYELARSVGEQRLDAVICMACSTAQPGTNAFGESGGWSVALRENVNLVLGGLTPVSDLYSPLFLLLLYDEWERTGDLRSALAMTRARLRSGSWVDDAQQETLLKVKWVRALEEAAAWATSHFVHLPSHAFADLTDPRAAVERLFYERHELYGKNAELRTIAETMVIFG